MGLASRSVAMTRFALLLAFLVPAAAQESAPPAAPEEPAKLFYTGDPLILPLQCRSDHLMQAGLVCNEDSPCDLFLELVDIGEAGEKVVVAGNVHTSAVTVSSVLLVSEDQGTSWREDAERMGAAGFELIQFIDKDHGWVAGQAWQIDTSSQPFLLATTNGGARWDRLWIWDEDTDRSGAILDFHFDTPQHGYLLIDRLISEGDPYELYESMNGGRSWHIRQVSHERVEIPRGPLRPAAPQWRLRTDQHAGAYEVERLVAGNWVRTARFASRAGSCYSMETEEEAKEETEVSGKEEPETEKTPASDVFRIPSRRFLDRP